MSLYTELRAVMSEAHAGIGKRKVQLRPTAWLDRGQGYILDTEALLAVDFTFLAGRDESMPPDTILVYLHPLDLTELRALLRPASDQWIAAAFVDLMVVKNPELRARLNW